MEARNAAGRRVSLLNDTDSGFDKAQLIRPLHQHHPLSFQAPASHGLARPYPSHRSTSSSPNTPELLRSDSYDSQLSNDPISPLTPSVDYAFSRSSLYAGDVPSAKRPSYVDRSRSGSFEDESTGPTAVSERPGKRYPCRYRDTHGCEKTFTTSGHASRHSKIHTAEKAVQCTYHGCQKKFTRADNMKQHLETHYKDKTRSSASQRAQKAAIAEARRNSSAGRSRSSTATTSSSRDAMQWESDAYVAPSQPVQYNLPILNRPATGRSPSSGLDALAMAIACQEGGRA